MRNEKDVEAYLKYGMLSLNNTDHNKDIMLIKTNSLTVYNNQPLFSLQRHQKYYAHS